MRTTRLFLLLLCSLFAFGAALAAEATRTFAVPAGDAADTLRRFAQQAGREIVYPANEVRGQQTNAVSGTLPVAEALAKLLAGTRLVATTDAKTGAVSVTTAAESPKAPAAPRVDPALARPAASPSDSEAVVLSPFVVETERDNGYQATSTLSGTRTNELLRNLPMAVSVLNQELINDIAATDPAALFNYGIGIEPNNATGIGTPYGDGSNSVVVRGIQSSWNSRDGFIWYAISDNFNTENIEILRGPSGNIYGDGRAGGVMNIATKRAKLRDFSSLALRWDSEGSLRATIDYNQKLSAKAAVRVNLVKSDERYWQDTAYDRREGLAVAFNYEFTKRSRFTGTVERNLVHRVNQRGLLTDNFSSGYVLGSGTNALGANPAGTGAMQAAGTTQRWTVINEQMFNLENRTTAVFRQTTGIPTNQTAAVSESIIPRHQQWNGPSDQLNNNSWAVNAAFEQLVGEHTTLEAAFNLQVADRQDYFSNLDGPRRDVNPFLPGPNNTLVPNPNFDQLYVDYRYTSGKYWNTVPSYRLTALHDFDFKYTTQRVILTTSLRDERFRLIQRQELLSPAAIAAAGLTGTEARLTNNQVRRRFYLKDGNDGNIRRMDRADIDFAAESPGGQKSHQPFTSYSLLSLGRYWQNRIISTVGVRRDNFVNYRPNLLTDAVTGMAHYQHNEDGTEFVPKLLNLWTTRYNYGVVFSPIKQARAFWTYQENFQQSGAVPYFNGDTRVPSTGVGIDYGVSAYLLDDRITATVTYFDNKAENQNVNVLASQNIVDEINNLLGTTYNTGTPQDTRSRKTKGWEFELVANPTPQWAVSFKWSSRELVNTDFVPRFTALLARMKAATNDSSRYALTQAQYDAVTVENANNGMNWNVTTRYSFDRGPLKGLRVGAYGYLRQKKSFDFTNRPSLSFGGYVMTNVFANYSYKLMQKYRCDLQLNVENLLNNQARLGNNYTSYSFNAPTKLIVTQRFNF